jgi:hypothetical protein
MFFDKDGFSKEFEQLKEIMSHAKNLVEKAENNENTRSFSQINKLLELGSKHLKSLYNQIINNNTSWDETTLKKRQGDYENIVTHYKSIQQRAEEIHAERRKFSP